MTFLIDGYNLMHAIGLARRDMPAAKFERARTELLDWLADGVDGRADVRIVFDAQNAPIWSPESLHHGVHVRFAFGETADDAIEGLIAAEAKPKSLTVVSNDARVRESARRAGCATLSCEELVDWMISKSREQEVNATRVPEIDKPQPTSREVDELLDVFSKPKRKR